MSRILALFSWVDISSLSVDESEYLPVWLSKAVKRALYVPKYLPEGDVLVRSFQLRSPDINALKDTSADHIGCFFRYSSFSSCRMVDDSMKVSLCCGDAVSHSKTSKLLELLM